jgi:hypothetical protein
MILLHQRTGEETGGLGDAKFKLSARLACAVFEQGLITLGPVVAIECLPQLWQHAASPRFHKYRVLF